MITLQKGQGRSGFNFLSLPRLPMGNTRYHTKYAMNDDTMMNSLKKI